MNRILLPSTLLTGLIAGAVGTTALTKTKTAATPVVTREVVNAELIFHILPDGGSEAVGRACGYDSLIVDGGTVRIGEPCWNVRLSRTNALMKDLKEK